MMDAEPKTDEKPAEMALQIRQARSEDIDPMIALDARITGIACRTRGQAK